MTSLQVTPELALSLDTRPVPVANPDADFDRRWAAWLAKGHANDVRMRRRMHVAAWLLGTGIVSWPAWGPVLMGILTPARS